MNEIPCPLPDRPTKKKPKEPPVKVVKWFRNGELLSDKTFQPYFFPLNDGQDFEGFDEQDKDDKK